MSRDDEEPESGPSRQDLSEDEGPGKDLAAARESERRRNRSALVGAIAVFVVIVLTIIGVWTSIASVQSVSPGVQQSVPAPAPRSP